MHDIQDRRSGDLCPVFCDGKKLTGFQQSVLWSLCLREPDRPTGLILKQFAEEGEPLCISVRLREKSP